MNIQIDLKLPYLVVLRVYLFKFVCDTPDRPGLALYTKCTFIFLDLTEESFERPSAAQSCVFDRGNAYRTCVARLKLV